MDTLTAKTRTRLEYMTRSLAYEFDSVPRPEVVREVDAIAGRLLDGARFDDYVPVLAHRYARVRLRKRVAVDSLAGAA